MNLELKSLRSSRRMPIPRQPRVEHYGESHVGNAHAVRLFPAIVRDRKQAKVDALVESDESTCYFHPKLPATALCELSGRMICELCRTEWNGQTVSFEALHTMSEKKASARIRKQQTQWDVVAVSTAVFPLLFWPITLVTAPLALFFSIWKWKEGPTSPVRKNRWRFVVAAVFALLQIVGWGFLLVGMIANA